MEFAGGDIEVEVIYCGFAVELFNEFVDSEGARTHVYYRPRKFWPTGNVKFDAREFLMLD